MPVGLFVSQRAHSTPALSQHYTLSPNLFPSATPTFSTFNKSHKHMIRIIIICKSCLNKRAKEGRKKKRPRHFWFCPFLRQSQKSEACPVVLIWIWQKGAVLICLCGCISFCPESAVQYAGLIKAVNKILAGQGRRGHEEKFHSKMKCLPFEKRNSHSSRTGTKAKLIIQFYWRYKIRLNFIDPCGEIGSLQPPTKRNINKIRANGGIKHYTANNNSNNTTNASKYIHMKTYKWKVWYCKNLRLNTSFSVIFRMSDFDFCNTSAKIHQ